MTYSFDKIIDRRNTNSSRWDQYESSDILPLSVADMDFAIAPEIQTALVKRIEHGILGYSHQGDLTEKIQAYLKKEFQWSVDQEDILVCAGVVPSLYMIPKVLMNHDDHAILPAPIYHHFFLAMQQAHRAYSSIHLKVSNDRWVFDLEELQKAIQPNTKLLMICNPQNPGGTVLSKDELLEIGQLCVEKDLLICSDEIHAQLVLDEHVKHKPIASLSPEISNRTITLMSLNKAFNFPGIGLSWCVCTNPDIRKKLQSYMAAQAHHPNALAYTATATAIDDGGPWHLELIQYLRGNRDLIRDWLSHHDQVTWKNSEATYLAWLDFSQLGWDNVQAHLIKNGLALSAGNQFGNEYSQFGRLNFGVPKATLIEALKRIETAINSSN